MTHKSRVCVISLVISLLFIGMNGLFTTKISVNDFGQLMATPDYKISQWTLHDPIYVHGITNFTQTANAEAPDRVPKTVECPVSPPAK